MKSLIHNLGMLMFLGGLPAVFMASFSCREKDEPCLTCPPPYVQTIFLDTTYTEPTEIGVRVTMADSLATSIVQIFRDTTEIFSKRVLAADTMIIDDSLLPARIYRYIAYRQTNGQRVDSSNVLTVRTMDTTSHDFTWEIDTLGDGNSSVLYDVAIVNDTLAYAVGEIYKRDSTGQFETDCYNLVKWNGVEWKLIRVPTKIWNTNSFMYGPLSAIYCFDANNICVTTGGQVIWYNGTNWGNWQFLFNSFDDQTFGGINKFWGTSKENLYGVGNKGNIFYFDGTTWRRLESGTDVSLLDVWGSPDGSTVWACGWEDFKPTVLLRLRNEVWEKVYEDQAHRFIIREDSLSGNLTSGLTTFQNKLFILSDAGLYKTSYDTRGAAERISFPATWSGFPWRVRGIALNDIVIVGEYYMVGHYNGFTLKHYPELSGYGRLRSVSQKGNLVVAVGISFDSINRYAIVFKGRR